MNSIEKTSYKNVNTINEQKFITYNSSKSNEEIGQAILEFLKTYQTNDEKAMRRFIDKDRNVLYFYQIGANSYSYSDFIAEDVSKTYQLPNVNIPLIKVEWDQSPKYSCDDSKWNLPSGVYANTKTTDYSDLLALDNENPIKTHPKIQHIEQNAIKITVINNDESAGIFFLEKINNEWKLLMVDLHSPCDA